VKKIVMSIVLLFTAFAGANADDIFEKYVVDYLTSNHDVVLFYSSMKTVDDRDGADLAVFFVIDSSLHDGIVIEIQQGIVVDLFGIKWNRQLLRYVISDAMGGQASFQIDNKLIATMDRLSFSFNTGEKIRRLILGK